jgi:hypothetical protein
MTGVAQFFVQNWKVLPHKRRKRRPRRDARSCGYCINATQDYGGQREISAVPLTEAIQRRTYVVCLACGQEFDYNWREMRIGVPVGELSIPPSALQAEQSVAH